MTHSDFLYALNKKLSICCLHLWQNPVLIHMLSKRVLSKRIMHNEAVEWNWTLLSQCIDAESDAIELLEAIVTLWVTVRGFSITATWMEVYKSTTKKTNVKNPGLRKGLSRKRN